VFETNSLLAHIPPVESLTEAQLAALRALARMNLSQDQTRGLTAWHSDAVVAGELVEILGVVGTPEDQALRAEAVRRLVLLLQGPYLPVSERLKAALLLTRLGGSYLPTPEQPDSWCPIEPGPCWLGDETQEALEPCTLPSAYRIARFPVTNAEYRTFIEAGSADLRQDWWTEEGRKWLTGQEPAAREQWDHPHHNLPTQPVVEVSWYEAVAYCGWLTDRGHREGWPPAEAIIRLPTYAEWVRAARHTDQRRYPWGNFAPSPQLANYDAAAMGRPTPVGCFPRGAAVCGAQDMLGNVWEWTATPWGQPHQLAPLGDGEPYPEIEQRPIVASTGFPDGEEGLCCGARYWFNRNKREDFLGFRVVWSSPGPDAQPLGAEHEQGKP
jgi:formylglycine-generating enzyme required for sulfatase activity